MTFNPMSVEITCVTLPKDHCVQVKPVTLVYLYHVNCCGHHKKLSIAKLDFVQVCGLSLNFYNITLHKFLQIQRQSGDLNKSNFAIGWSTNQQTILPASNAPKSVLSWSISISRILGPSSMTIHQCMWIQWPILQNTTLHTTYYVHITYILRTYYVHTTYRNEWSHSLLLNSVQVRQKVGNHAKFGIILKLFW